MASKPAPSEDNFEMKAIKAMGDMEDGDAVFGSGAEVNLDSQVSCLGHIYSFFTICGRAYGISLSLSMMLIIMQ